MKGSHPTKKILENLIERIIKVLESLFSIAYFHFLCDLNKDMDLCVDENCKFSNLNKDTDLCVDESCKFSVGDLKIYGQINSFLIL